MATHCLKYAGDELNVLACLTRRSSCHVLHIMLRVIGWFSTRFMMYFARKIKWFLRRVNSLEQRLSPEIDVILLGSDSRPITFERL